MANKADKETSSVVAKELSKHLASNIITLRKKQNYSQMELSKKAGIPRSTLTYMESGESNPSLTNLVKISAALHVSVEELISQPQSRIKLTKAKDIPIVSKSKSQVIVEKLLPDPIPGMEIDRMVLKPGSRMKGTPHISKTKEYMYCEEGSIRVYVQRGQYDLKKGDALAFPGDEPHAYENLSRVKKAVCFSVVVFAPSGV